MQFALKGLSEEQIRAAASSLGLNASQQAVVLSAAGVESADIAATLASNGYTEAMIRQALATAGVEEAQISEIVSTEAFAAAMASGAAATDSFTASITAAAAGLWAFLTTNPVGWAILAVGAIAGIVGVVDLLTESMEEAEEKAKESREAYEEQQRTLESLNSELETTRRRIEELNGKAGLTLVEQRELENLKSQNALLEQQIELEKILAVYRHGEAADDAKNVLTKEAFAIYGDDGYGNREKVDIIKYAETIQKTIDLLKKEKEELQKDIGGLTDPIEIEEYKRQIGWIDEQIASYGSDLAEQMDTISEQAELLYDENGNVLSGYEALAGRVDALNKFIIGSVDEAADEAAARQAEIDSFLSRPTLSRAVEEAEAKARELNGITLSQFEAQFPALAAAAEEAGLEIVDVVNSINSAIGNVNPIPNYATGGAELRNGLIEKYNGSYAGTRTSRYAVLEFGDALDSLTDDELRSFYASVENVNTAAWTFDDWMKAIKESCEAFGGTAEESAVNAEDLADALSTLGDLYDLLTKAQSEMDAGGLSSGTAQSIIKELEEAGEDYTKYLTEENGVLRLNTEAWNAYIAAKRAAAEQAGDVGKAVVESMIDEAALTRLNEAKDRLEDLQKALDGLDGADGLSTDAYEALEGLLPGITTRVNSVKDAQNILNEAIAKQKEAAAEAYAEYVWGAENSVFADEDRCGKILADNQGLTDALNTCYGVDLDRWGDLAKGKWQVDKSLVSSLSELWQKYHNMSDEEIQSSIDRLKALGNSVVDSGSSDMGLNRFPDRQLKPVAIDGGGTARGLTDAEKKELADLEAVLAIRKNLEKQWEELNDEISKNGLGGSDSKKVEEYIADIDQYREALERLSRVRIHKEDLELDLSNTEDLQKQVVLQNQLIASYRDEQEALHHLNELRRDTLLENTERLRELGFTVDFDPENNQFFVQNMEHINDLTAKSKGSYETLQEATNGLRKETEDLINSLEALNEENQKSSANWLELQYSIEKAKIAIIDDLKEIVVQASGAVDEIQEVSDTLHEAADELAANGFITVDTFQSIVELGAQYMQYLTDENGMLKINHDSIEAVIAAKTRELAMNEALTYVERLRLSLQDGNLEQLQELLYATKEASGGTWELVYANLALLDLDGEQYQAALHNINAIRALAETAASGVGQAAGSVSDELQDMKTGLDDILKYVMDMLRQKIRDQIDALEDMKSAYAELIDLRKKSLENAEKEAGYQEEVAEKTRELAKLQGRIDALGLDNSRDASAQRARLEEEMANLQKELADTQADHAREAQENALDDMQRAYEEEKDGEIAALEESISSTEKLYRMAIDYIRNNWETLKDELIQWNYEVGTNFQYEIENAWEAALRAAQRYGDYVTALGSIDADIDSAGGSAHNDLLGKSTGPTETAVHNIIREMWANAQSWFNADENDREKLDERNLQLGKELAAYGINARRDDGTWYVGDELLFEKYRKYLYHKGGIAGDRPTLKQNEVMAVLEKGEPVLDKRKEAGLFRLVDFTTDLMNRFSRIAAVRGAESLFEGARRQVPKVGTLLPEGKRSPSVQFGDVYIYGADERTVEKHREVNRQFVNEVIKQLNLKK